MTTSHATYLSPHMGIVLPPGLSLTSPASTATAHGSINTHHGGGHNSIIASSQVMRTRSPHSKYRGPQGTLLYLPEMFLKRVCHYFTIGCARFYFSSIYLLFFLQKRISEYNILHFVFASIFQMLFSFFFPCLWKGVGKTYISTLGLLWWRFKVLDYLVPSTCSTLEKSSQIAKN